MPSESTSHTIESAKLATGSLNQRRRRAVELRLEGCSLATIQAEVNLSNPTIINAHKAFLNGGWEAVDRKPRGRSAGGVALGGDEDLLLEELLALAPEAFDASQSLWNYRMFRQWLADAHQRNVSLRTATKYAERWELTGASTISALADTESENPSDAKEQITDAKSRGLAVLSMGTKRLGACTIFYAHDARGSFSWLVNSASATVDSISDFLNRLMTQSGKPFLLLVSGLELNQQPAIGEWFQANGCECLQVPRTANQSGTQKSPVKKKPGPQVQKTARPATQAVKQPGAEAPVKTNAVQADSVGKTRSPQKSTKHLSKETTDVQAPLAKQAEPDIQVQTLSHLARLEAESIHILREVIAEADKPVMLFSLGKDSAVMLHLAKKAFYPAPLPMPLLHVDTTWKFKTMYDYREQLASDPACELIVHINEEGLDQGVNPITHGSSLHTDIMKTEALKQALGKHQFDVAIAGARRDEERSRAKERVFSFRNQQQRWDPRNQRPELWNLFNTRKNAGESIRAFPLSNWTELDIWQYIHAEKIDVVPLYFAAERPVVERDGNLILVDDERLPLNDGEVPTLRTVRFRTLGCYPLTSATESTATTVPEIVAETLTTHNSERMGRMIDHDGAASMEKKKQEGYF